MSACAGSSTRTSTVWASRFPQDRTPCFWFEGSALAPVKKSPDAQERKISGFSPARFRWTAPGRIGFMSRQRGEKRSSRRAWLAAGGCTAASPKAGWPQLSGHGSPHFEAGSARLVGVWPRVLARCVQIAACRPPHQRTQVVPSAHPWPPGCACFHLSLPRFPAALRCRTERYDGKRNLHFLHAA